LAKGPTVLSPGPQDPINRKEWHLRERFPPFVVVLGLALIPFAGTPASAAPNDPWAVDWLAPNSESGLRASSPAGPTFSPAGLFPAVEPESVVGPNFSSAVPAALFLDTPQEAAQTRPHAIEYSHGYEVRRKIHVYASFAMIPLFVTQGILGGKLYNEPTDGVRSAHKAVAWTIAGLFGANTVTGLWNLKEGWKNPEHRKLRLTHGLLMLGADAGFLATALTAPNSEGTSGDKSTHRAVAITAIAAATTGYLVMIFGR
jgi:hypothetical protein